MTTARPLRLVDLMILVAAVAVGIAVAEGGSRWAVGDSCLEALADTVRTIAEDSSAREARPYAGLAWSQAAMGSMNVGGVIVAVVGLAVLVQVWPRGRIDRAARLGEPGFVALLAGSIGGAWVGLERVLALVIGRAAGARFEALPAADWATCRPPELIGILILVGWGLLVLDRGWHPAPHWVDRLGRLIGLFWIAAAVLAGTVGEDLVQSNAMIRLF